MNIMRDNYKSLAVIHFIKYTKETTIASAKIAKFISDSLLLDLIDDKNKIYKKYSVLYIVNSPFLYCNFKSELKVLVNYCDKVFWIQNDFAITIPGFIKKKLCKIFTTIENNNNNSEYINWNKLTYNNYYKQTRVDIKKGLFYYGAYRKGREKYFKKYFQSNNYDINISCSQKSLFKFSQINNNINFYKPFYDIRSIYKFQIALYIEDEFSHKTYCSPANRFYEMLSIGIPIFFDSSVRNTFKKADIDISNYIVCCDKDIEGLLKSSEDVRKEQHIKFTKDYKSELNKDLMKIWNNRASI